MFPGKNKSKIDLTMTLIIFPFSVFSQQLQKGGDECREKKTIP